MSKPGSIQFVRAFSIGHEKKWEPFILPGLSGLLVLLFIMSLNLGRYGLPISQIFAAIADQLFGLHISYPSEIYAVLFNIRIPRLLTGILVGWALSASGAAYQGLFKNPMVSPDILGASAGSGFGAAIAILFSFSDLGIQIFAFIFGLAAVCITYFLTRAIGLRQNVIILLVLTGMVVEALFTAMTSIVKYVADPDSKLPEITFWLMGSLSRTLGMGNVVEILIPVILGSVPLLIFRWKLNVTTFGDEEAKSLGVNTAQVRLVVIFCSTLLTSSSISIAGLVGWVGLVIPHVARILVGPDFRRMMPASMIIGGIFLLLTDDVARTALSVEIPLGILTAVIGAPVFLFLLFKSGKNWL